MRLISPPSTRRYSARSRSEEHTSELQSQSNLVCRLLLEKKKNNFLTDLKNELLNSRSRQNSYLVGPVEKVLQGCICTLDVVAMLPVHFLAIIPVQPKLTY